MKTRILLVAVAAAFSFVLTSCGNKKAADANVSAADSCCAAMTEQCDSMKACCTGTGGEAACQGECGESCGKCDKADCDKACEKK